MSIYRQKVEMYTVDCTLYYEEYLRSKYQDIIGHKYNGFFHPTITKLSDIVIHMFAFCYLQKSENQRIDKHTYKCLYLHT